ncbi:hypothetical protein UT300007_08610 [Clostridium sp. CTA-7]
MASLEKNVYILKQSNGTIWNFLFDKRFGIVYKILKGEMWANYNTLTRATTGNFSVNLLPNDNICLVYEDLDGNLIMNLYDHKKWNSYYLIENDEKEKIDIYFKTLFYKNELFLFYSIYNKNTNILTIVSQLVDERGNLAPPKLIDYVNFKYDIPFYIYTSTENILYIMYQKQENNYLLGYRILDDSSKNWSKFHVIDDCSSPFEEYSLLSLKDKIHSLYIKKDDNDIYSLIHCEGNSSSYNYNNICSHRNIISSAFFIIDKHIWCLWIQDNKIYSTVSIDGGNVFSTPPQVELIDSQNISKLTYLSNFLENNKDICRGELFLKNVDYPHCLVIDDIYGIVHRNNKNNSYLFYLQYFISALNKEDNHYKSDIVERAIAERDILIEKLYNMVKEKESKLVSYESKFKAVNENLAKFNKNKNELNEGIKLLEDSLLDKEKKLNELQMIYIEKENELELLKEELSNIKLQEINGFDIKKTFNKFSSIFKN